MGTHARVARIITHLRAAATCVTRRARGGGRRTRSLRIRFRVESVQARARSRHVIFTGKTRRVIILAIIIIALLSGWEEDEEETRPPYIHAVTTCGSAILPRPVYARVIIRNIINYNCDSLSRGNLHALQVCVCVRVRVSRRTSLIGPDFMAQVLTGWRTAATAKVSERQLIR